MATDDRCVTIQPYFRIKEGAEDRARAYLEKLVALARTEPGCLYYGFSLNGNRVYCREGYVDAQAALAHAANVGAVLQEVLQSGDLELTEIQIHGPAQELEPLRAPLAPFNPTFWVLEYGFRK